MLAFDCPRCGFCITVPEELAGKTGACAKCRTRITAPASASTLPAATAEEFLPVDLSTLEIDVDNRVRGLTPMHIDVRRSEATALDLPPEPVQVACGLFGAALLVAGVFVPVLEGRQQGVSINLLGTDHGEGWIILVMAAVAAGMCYRKRFRWLYIPAVIVAALVAASYYVHHSQIREIEATLNTAAGVQTLRWGWIVPAVGALLTFAASALQPRAN